MHLGVFHQPMMDRFSRVLAPLNLSPNVQRFGGYALMAGGAWLVYNWFRR